MLFVIGILLKSVRVYAVACDMKHTRLTVKHVNEVAFSCNVTFEYESLVWFTHSLLDGFNFCSKIELWLWERLITFFLCYWILIFKNDWRSIEITHMKKILLLFSSLLLFLKLWQKVFKIINFLSHFSELPIIWIWYCYFRSIGSFICKVES